MSKRLFAWTKIALAVMIAFAALAACTGNVNQAVRDAYPLESVVREGNQRSYVYRAANETVPEVAGRLANERTPEQVSQEDPQQMFLVYPDELYNLQQDTERPGDTIIEVSNDEFVRQNYSMSFLQGYLLASIVGSIFDGRGTYYGGYRGYTSRQYQKPSAAYRQPTAEEKRILPPLTKQGAGSIIRRSDAGGTAGSGVKRVPDSAVPGERGNIIRSPDNGGTDVTPRSSRISPPRSAPPRIRSGGGRIIRRR